MKYDSADCKTTEGENALSVLEEKRQTREKWMGEAILVMKMTNWLFLLYNVSGHCKSCFESVCELHVIGQTCYICIVSKCFSADLHFCFDTIAKALSSYS